MEQISGKIEWLLEGLPVARIVAAYTAAPGGEVAKLGNPASSAALAANAFGWFLEQPSLLTLPLGRPHGPVRNVSLETEVRFPWTGGRHPWLDVLIETDTSLIGVESKRYEPFRPQKRPEFSDAFWRDVWGPDMTGYQSIRDRARDFRFLGVAQLVKHALGLLSETRRRGANLTPVLLYLYAEPSKWPDGRVVSPERKAQHRDEITEFAREVAKDQVVFVPLDYKSLLGAWRGAGEKLSQHATVIEAEFGL